ncbi:2-acylglycerol O-acyltransferase 2-A-like [Ornithorhynchus anatinus]|uniref:Acyltransferase n=1 Tax=Ornithorhynchus anatinus TaxID=9258 RepID=F6YUL5_ORNAN|nr:2-acylglycerol O-acyltransferase 2-A-like [Ornithorhynchus anatinus]
MRPGGCPSGPALRRRLQTAAVIQWVFSFLGLGPLCLVLFALTLVSRAWLVALGYAAWLFWDRETPRAGGRRNAWVRNWPVWTHFRDYFPISLVKTAELCPSRNYLFAFHPHGVLVAGAFANFCTEATGFSRLFPGLRPYLLMLPCWFRLPLFRDYIMSGGLVSSDKASASHVLGQAGGGQVAVIAVGGPAEALEARPAALTLHLRNRMGFIKLALEHGASLVPVFSFGENDLYDQVPNPRGSGLRRVQDWLLRRLGLAFPLFHAHGLLPFRSPVTTVVGAPLPVPRTAQPSRAQVSSLHRTYVAALIRLFEEHKGRYGVPPDRHLVID